MPTETEPVDASGAALTPPPAGVEADDNAAATRPFKREKKVYDPQSRPFHRLRSPSYDRFIDKEPNASPAIPSEGKGYDCGCRCPDDYKKGGVFKKVVRYMWQKLKEKMAANNPKALDAYEKIRAQILAQTGHDIEEETVGWVIDTLCGWIEEGIFGSYMRSIPSWVPVNREGYGPKYTLENAHNVAQSLGPDGQPRNQEVEVEVEGKLTRSYLTRHHRIYTQWNRFYPWSFHVDPAPGFRHLIGKGNQKSEEERKSDGLDLNGRNQPAHLIYEEARQSLECLMDIGTFSKAPGDQDTYNPVRFPSQMFDHRWPFWPQSGDWFWGTGRYVYDCTHPTSDDRAKGLHPTAIHPLKAFAVARYDAFRFEEQPDTPIPAVRFMFFANRKGGYWDFDGDIKMSARDYEFAVDLPPRPVDRGEHAIGRAPQFPFNSVVVRPRLLKHIEFGPFETDRVCSNHNTGGTDSKLGWWKDGADPIVQLTRTAPGMVARMAKVTVPVSKMPDNVDAYAFVLTLGWYSPEAASRVKKVTVKLPSWTQVAKKDFIRLVICINGRHIYYPVKGPISKDDKPFSNVRDGYQQWPPDTGLALELPTDGKVTITAHGTRRNGIGRFMEEQPAFDKKDPVNGTNDRRLRFGALIKVPQEILDGVRNALNAFLTWFPKELMDDELRKMLSDEELQNALLGSVFGDRRFVEWAKHVDADTDAAPAVAREMKFFPLSTYDANDPLGHIDTPPTGQSGTGTDVTFTVDTIAQHVAVKNAPLTVEYWARETKQVPHNGMVYFDSQRQDTDYKLSCSLTVGDPDEKAEPK